MNGTHQIEPASSCSQLACLISLAIDEARLVREIVQTKGQAHKQKSVNPFTQRLIYLNREIAYLEQKLAEVRSLAVSPHFSPV